MEYECSRFRIFLYRSNICNSFCFATRDKAESACDYNLLDPFTKIAWFDSHRGIPYDRIQNIIQKIYRSPLCMSVHAHSKMQLMTWPKQRKNQRVLIQMLFLSHSKVFIVQFVRQLSRMCGTSSKQFWVC